MDEVIKAARKGYSPEWYKYSDGKWDEPGLTGLSDNMMSNLGIDFNMHCKATYVPSIEKYVMLTYNRRAPGLYLLVSDNALQWEIADMWKDHNTNKRISYPFIADFYSWDSHEVDDDFYIYWTRDHRELWGSRVRVDKK